MQSRWQYTGQRALLFLIALFTLSAFALLSVREDVLDVGALLLGAACAALLLVQYLVLTHFFPGLDRYVMLIVQMLVSVGFVMQYRLNPDYGILQVQWFGVAMVANAVALLAVRYVNSWYRWRWWIIFGGLALLALSILFGRWTYGAKNWLSIAGQSFQPSEAVKVLLVILSATLLADYRGARSLIPLVGFVGASIVLLLLQRDLGAALLYALTTLLTLFAATGSWLLLGAGTVVGTAAAVLSYRLFSHVRVRVAIWKNPWAQVESAGYQIVQGLAAIASGGLLGLGLCLGSPRSIPAYHTDFIFAVICEEFGILFGLLMIVLYVLLVLRGIRIALHAQSRFDALLAFGVTAMLAVQTFVILGGVIKMIPLTGITLPFVSYGGSSLVTNMALIGALEAVAVRTETERRSLADLEEKV